ncbi:ABC transporter ATP-binding protein [Ruminococcus sp. 2227st1_E6_2227SCRN_220401]|uniref:ABC transporter ATP-binding protein n=1 Tax=unclassified Ruminococcus TaxID=2608920 RepID=UPI00319DA792
MTEKRKRMKKSVVILRLLGYLWKYKGWLCFAGFLVFAANLIALKGPELSGKAIDAIVGKGNVDFPLVYRYAFQMLLVYLISAALSYLLALVMIHISKKVVYIMRRQVFEHLIDLPVDYFDKNPIGDLISRLTYDIDTINASLSNDLLQICAGTITVVGCTIQMVRIAPILMLVFLVTIPCLIIFTIIRVKKVRPLFRRRSAKLGELNGYAEEMLSGQKTIRAYGKEEVMIERFETHNVEAVDAFYKADYQGSIVGPSVNFINNISMSLISLFGALLYLRGSLSLGNLSAFILYSRRFSGPINETANIISEIQSATSAAERVFHLLDEKVEEKQKENDLSLEQVEGNVELTNVSFGYTEEKEVLHDINLVIPKGSTVAIVGPTGGGKTTLISLLMRFYDPKTGEIRIDGHNTYHRNMDDVRRSFAMVLQDTWLFGGTIRENLLYGNPKADEQALQNAVKAVHLEDYIESLPDGYDTILNENGGNISKGQKQLITIARAMLVEAPMLILDEATSNVDSRTELKLQEAMNAITQNKTCVIVAHRLSTVQNADKILVIRNGCIVEAGNHQELLLRKGFYAELYNSQFEFM